MAKQFDKKSPFKTQFLEKGQFTPKYLELARTVNDSNVVGKSEF